MPPVLLPSVALAKSERLTTANIVEANRKIGLFFYTAYLYFTVYFFAVGRLLLFAACFLLPLVAFKGLCCLTACRFYARFLYTAFEKNQIFCAKYIDISYFSDIISNRRIRVLTVKQKDCQRSQAKGERRQRKAFDIGTARNIIQRRKGLWTPTNSQRKHWTL